MYYHSLSYPGSDDLLLGDVFLRWVKLRIFRDNEGPQILKYDVCAIGNVCLFQFLNVMLITAFDNPPVLSPAIIV